jgi:hypothetical protein
MTTKETHKKAIEGLDCLQKAVQRELAIKASLNQTVIINVDGNACKVSAREALQMAMK